MKSVTEKRKSRRQTYGTKDGGKKPNPNDLNSFKGFFYYMIIIVVMTVLLNGLVFPSALKSQVKEVGYNEFLTWWTTDRSHRWKR